MPMGTTVLLDVKTTYISKDGSGGGSVLVSGASSAPRIVSSPTITVCTARRELSDRCVFKVRMINALIC